MISKKKIFAIVLFIVIGLFMFSFANPAEIDGDITPVGGETQVDKTDLEDAINRGNGLLENLDKETDLSNKLEEALCEKFNFNLNDSQKKAVKLALGKNDLLLVQGPPGTGKTQVIAETCLQLLTMNPGLRILVCSETHVAVNNLLSRIARYCKGIRIVRIRDKENDDIVDGFAILAEDALGIYKDQQSADAVGSEIMGADLPHDCQHFSAG